MDQKISIPKFRSEADEANWWFENQDAVFGDFKRAGEQETLGRGTAARLASAASGSIIALDPEDAERARAQAQRRGLDFEAYVRMVVHRALLVDERSA